MVTSVTSFGRSGLYDWMVQRVSAVILLAYTIFLLAFLVKHPNLQYQDWQNLFAQSWVRVFSLLTLISLVAHAWIGLWSVTTDYLTERAIGKAGTAIRFCVQALCGVLAFAYLIWGVQILWGL